MIRSFKIGFLLLFLALAEVASATHLIGGYMSYTYLGNAPSGNSRYRIKISVYRDCFQSDVPFDDEIPLGIYDNNQSKDLYKVEKLSLGNVSRVRPPGSDDCDYYAKNVCIEFGYYEGVIEVRPSDEGYHLTFVRCCRNHQDNIPDADGAPFQGQTYYGFIPGNSFKNSSPAFSSIPSSFICANDTAKIVFNAVDPDGDELVYKFVRPFQGGEPTTNGSIPDPPDTLETPIQPVFYNTGYNADYPFGINNGSYTSIDEKTGLAKIVATENGSYVLAVEVSEIRNGQVLSVVRMDLQVLVLDCPTNSVPSLITSADKEVHVTAGETLCFSVRGSDADEDELFLNAESIVLTGSNGFKGNRATFPVKRDKGVVISQFCWDTDCEHAQDQPYVVTFKVEDDGCPPKSNYVDVAIFVDSFLGAKELVGPKEVCRYNEHWYDLKGGRPNSQFHWQVSEGLITSEDSLSRVLIDWEGTGIGTIKVREESASGCLGDWVEMDVNIKESPTLTTISGKDTVCLNEKDLAFSVIPRDGNSYSWFVMNATVGSINNTKLVISQYNAPEFVVKLVEYNDLGCGGDTAYKYVHVSQPNPEIIGPTSICPNAINIKYQVEDNYGSSYKWNVVGGNQTSGGLSSNIGVDWGLEGLGSLSVIETNRHGCVSPENKLEVEKTYNLTSNPINGKREVCEFEIEAYETLEVNGSTFTWTVSGGNQIDGDSTAQIKVNWGAAGNGSVTMQEKAYDAKNGKACLSDKIELPVIIYPKPTATVINGVHELCQTEASTLYTVNGLKGSSFVWKLNNQILEGHQFSTDSIYLIWNSPGSFVLSVVEISDKGCRGDELTLDIVVNPKPITSPIQGNEIVCTETILNQKYSVVGFDNSTFLWNVYGYSKFVEEQDMDILVDWDLNSLNPRIAVLEISAKGCVGDTQRLNITFDLLTLDLHKVSVGYPDNYVIVAWDLPISFNDREVTVQKRKANTNEPWQYVLTTTLNQTPINEFGVNTDSFPYEYRLVALNYCGNQVVSDTHTLIWLTGNKNELLEVDLQFTPYLGWVEGVQAYLVYRSINNGPYEIIDNNAIANEVIHRPSDISIYKRCFLVVAEERNGELTTSQSNEICFFFEPELFVPNAFTANNDRLNDGFKARGFAINSFELQIYNRWGELVFQSNNIEEAWDANYRNSPAQQGVYTYVIRYTDYNEQVYSKTGTLHLIR